MNEDRSTFVEPTRRRMLATLGTITTAGLAGCAGGGGEDSPGGEGSTSDGDSSGGDPGSSGPGGSNDQSADVPWENDGGDTGGGGCPSTPLSYTSRDWPDQDPYVSFDIPQAGAVETEVNYRGLRIMFDDGASEITVWGAEGRSEQGYSDASVDERAANESRDELTEEYDVASGVRVFGTYAALEALPAVTTVFLPSGSGSLQVDIRIGGGSDIQCREAVVAAHGNLVDTMRTI